MQTNIQANWRKPNQNHEILVELKSKIMKFDETESRFCCFLLPSCVWTSSEIMTDQDKQGPINALKTKLELLTLKASLRHSSSTSFIHYNQDEHLYHRRVQEASYDPDGAIAAQKATAEAAKPKRRPASALAMKLDIALEPPAPTSVLRYVLIFNLRLQKRFVLFPTMYVTFHRPPKTAGGSRRSHKTPSNTTTAASTTRPAPIIAPPMSLSMQQGRWESDEDFLDRTRSVQSIRFANINFDNNVELPLKLNAHGIISWTMNHLNIPHSHRQLMDRALIHEGIFLFIVFIFVFETLFFYCYVSMQIRWHCLYPTFGTAFRNFFNRIQLRFTRSSPRFGPNCVFSWNNTRFSIRNKRSSQNPNLWMSLFICTRCRLRRRCLWRSYDSSPRLSTS
jgi:hypothetical protein